MTKILALTGGVGGAKLALGLAKVLSPDELLFAVNVGDDFEHFGLHISPDIDSLTYALAGINNQTLGWGRAGETWQFIETLASLGGEAWFRLGDKDLALHTRRAQLLESGKNLTQATAEIAGHLGIRHAIAPISDDPIRTIVDSEIGELAFQHYFVREQCKPVVNGFRFQGIEKAKINPMIQEWLTSCDGIIICPSNPFVSVAPILDVPGFKDAIEHLPIIAVSPIVAGKALKGPAAKMMLELKMPATAEAVARQYEGLIDGFVLDNRDAGSLRKIKIPAIATQSVMVDLDDRVFLARECIRFLNTLQTK
jgi:LPPG:FO 2-phospho-L-lactate transferase